MNMNRNMFSLAIDLANNNSIYNDYIGSPSASYNEYVDYFLSQYGATVRLMIDYAEEVGRLKHCEHVIARSYLGGYAYHYAKFIINDRFEMGEHKIMQHHTRKWYIEHLRSIGMNDVADQLEKQCGQV